MHSLRNRRPDSAKEPAPEFDLCASDMAKAHRSEYDPQEHTDMIRDTIKAAQVSAMKAGDKPRLAAVRLILAKLKDKDIELRTAATCPTTTRW
jgi:hypothetical protein